MYESVWVIILTQTTVYSQQLLLDETRQGDPRINGGDSHTKLYIPSSKYYKNSNQSLYSFVVGQILFSILVFTLKSWIAKKLEH